MPGPDEVAIKTLDVATRTLWVSMVAIGVGVVSIGVAIFDAWNNRKQLNLVLQDKARAPHLVVEISKLSDVVEGSDTDGSYYDLKATFEVANLNDATATADNVTVRLYFSEAITSTKEWRERKEAEIRRELARAVTSPIPPYRPAVSNRRKLITTERFLAGSLSDGYREVSFFDSDGVQLVPGTRTSISAALTLHVPATANALEWEALSAQGPFPKNGRGRIDLVAAAKRELAQ